MRLPAQEVERFYRIWFALLRASNEEVHIISEFPDSPANASLPVEKVVQLRNALWEDDKIRQRFIADNPAQLADADLAVVESWQYRIAGTFSIVRSLQQYTIFLSSQGPAHAYGVPGLVSAIEETLPLPLPIYVQAVLLPFEHHIIYDSLLVPYNVVLGSGIRLDLQNQYRDLQEREGIITSLLPEDHAISAAIRRREIPARNRKVFSAFRRELRKGGLSDHMVDVHMATIEDFAHARLLAADSPRGILDLTQADVVLYLEEHPGKQPVTGFKRFIRFLLNTDRIDYNLGESLRMLLNERPGEK